MKLFIGTNSSTIQSTNVKLLENLIESAIKNTDFEIYLMFDGKKEELDLPPSVNIIEHRHRCYETFLNAERTKREGSLQISSGAFLRTEIPFLMNQMGFDDEFCLYTDYDVIFQKSDYSELYNIKPKYFAASPETNINNWGYINSGVMLMNVKTLFEDDSKIINYINDNFENLTVWDQTLYNDLYKGEIDRLPLEYNWKPYWGINDNSKIVHFHGAKPRSVEPEWRYNLREIKTLRDMSKDGYEFYNDVFESNTPIKNIVIRKKNKLVEVMRLKGSEYETELRRFCSDVKEMIGDSPTIVELGSYMGEGSLIFAEEFPNGKIYCVDSWEGGFDDSDSCSGDNYNFVEGQFDLRMNLANNITKIKGLSTSVGFECDMVYIDACHKYECVKNDITHWLPFVKKIMSGHDYYEDINFCNQHPHIKGVKIAVEEMLGMPDKKYKDGSWLIVKK